MTQIRNTNHPEKPLTPKMLAIRNKAMVTVIISEIRILDIYLSNNIPVPLEFSELIIGHIKNLDQTKSSELKAKQLERAIQLSEKLVYYALTVEEKRLLKIGCNYEGPIVVPVNHPVTV